MGRSCEVLELIAAGKVQVEVAKVCAVPLERNGVALGEPRVQQYLRQVGPVLTGHAVSCATAPSTTAS